METRGRARRAGPRRRAPHPSRAPSRTDSTNEPLRSRNGWRTWLSLPLPCGLDLGTPCLVFVDGRFVAERSAVGPLPDGTIVASLGELLGQTPGKMLCGLKVDRTNAEPLGYGGAFLRWVGYFLSGVLFCLGFLWAAWDRQKQSWHDTIAGTYVIRL